MQLTWEAKGDKKAKLLGTSQSHFGTARPPLPSAPVDRERTLRTPRPGLSFAAGKGKTASIYYGNP